MTFARRALDRALGVASEEVEDEEDDRESGEDERLVSEDETRQRATNGGERGREGVVEEGKFHESRAKRRWNV